MMSCWSFKPDKRPSFADVVIQLSKKLPDDFRSVSYQLSPKNSQAAPKTSSSSSATSFVDRSTAQTYISDSWTGVPGPAAVAERGEPDGTSSRRRPSGQAEQLSMAHTTGNSYYPTGGGSATSNNSTAGLGGLREVSPLLKTALGNSSVVVEPPKTAAVTSSSSCKSPFGNHHFKWFH